MFEFLKSKPKVETVSKAEHDRIVGEQQIIIDNLTGASSHNYQCWIKASDELSATNALLAEERKTWVSTSMRLAVANSRLREIAALETPNCAHIGKRMARIARGEDQAREKGEVANG